MGPLCENIASATKLEVYITYRNAARGEPSQGIGNMHKNFKFGDVVFETDKQTDILITIIRTSPPGGGRE